MDYEEAKHKVLEFVNGKGTENPAILIEENTLTRDFGWVFFYQSKKYLEEKDVLSMWVGNAPVIVNKHSGEMKYTGTANPVMYYVEEYEKEQGT